LMVHASLIFCNGNCRFVINVEIHRYNECTSSPLDHSSHVCIASCVLPGVRMTPKHADITRDPNLPCAFIPRGRITGDQPTQRRWLTAGTITNQSYVKWVNVWSAYHSVGYPYRRSVRLRQYESLVEWEGETFGLIVPVIV
jgi:hypothetical protein